MSSFNYEYGMVMTTDKLAQSERILKHYPDILAAYLHGSTAKGTAREDSDIDIAVLPFPGKKIPIRTRLECAGELAASLGCPVDLGELSTRNLIYSKEVAVNGQQIFTDNRFESDRFMATCLAMYAELQERWHWAIHSSPPQKNCCLRK